MYHEDGDTRRLKRLRTVATTEMDATEKRDAITMTISDPDVAGEEVGGAPGGLSGCTGRRVGDEGDRGGGYNGIGDGQCGGNDGGERGGDVGGG